jgi:hypothetical protein
VRDQARQQPGQAEDGDQKRAQRKGHVEYGLLL